MPTIGPVARRVGVRRSTIRYWEAHGLVEPRGRSAKGYRLYDEAQVSLLRFVRSAQELGLSLAEIRELLALHHEGRRPCTRVRSLARRHVREIDARIEALRALRGELERLARRRPKRHEPGEVCPLIEGERTRRSA